jgi:predicted DNA-binding transcriptional regulator AlpA
MQLQSDFIAVTELAQLTGFERKSLYNWHSTGTGPLAPIMTKVGGRLGAWRADYESWRDAQRKLKSPLPEQRPAA